jgi:hypothetical protein
MNLKKHLEIHHITRTHFSRFESHYLLYVDLNLNNQDTVKGLQNILRVFI